MPDNPTPVAISDLPVALSASGVNLVGDDNGTTKQVPVALLADEITPADIGAVPTSRSINGNPLSADVTLTATDVGAAPDSTLATVEASSTASTNYAVGSYLVLGGILYRVTAAIASGETITPGTNVVSTTVTGITDGIAALLGGVVLGVYEVPANTTRNLSFIKEVKGGALIMSGGVSSKRGVYIYSSTSTGSVGVTAVLAVTQSGLSITGSGDDIVVVNGSNALFICVIAYKGALPTLTEPT